MSGQQFEVALLEDGQDLDGVAAEALLESDVVEAGGARGTPGLSSCGCLGTTLRCGGPIRTGRPVECVDAFAQFGKAGRNTRQSGGGGDGRSEIVERRAEGVELTLVELEVQRQGVELAREIASGGDEFCDVPGRLERPKRRNETLHFGAQ